MRIRGDNNATERTGAAGVDVQPTATWAESAVFGEVRVLPDLLDLRRGVLDPNRPALGDGTDAMTYGAYAGEVGRLASALVTLGVGRGDRVGVHLRKSVRSFVAVHGVLRAGAVMVPVDAFAPVDHAVNVIVDAGIEVLITDARDKVLAEVVRRTPVRALVQRRVGTPHVDVDSPDARTIAWDDLADHDPIEPTPLDPDDAAYVIYTSGSTGTPKGIVHTHRSALAYAHLAATTYELGPHDRLANVASLHFDQSTFELYAAPLAGAAVTVIPDAVLRFPANVAELIERDRVTVWYSVPYILRQLTARGALADRDLSMLRWVLYGGESFPPAELAAWMQAVPGARVSNVYGPAEVNQCTFFHLDEPPTADAGAIPIGSAWDDTELVLLGDDAQPVEVGTPGEVYVATTTMMAGYWKRPELTAAAIVERTVAGSAATRWYRTGDLAVQRSDGNVVFLGRADNQVKVRGQRLELEAIDLTIRTHPDVGDVAVVVLDDDDGERRLVAVIEPTAGAAPGAPTLAAVQRAVADVHPRAAVPVDLVVVSALDRTSTGKVDRNAALRHVPSRPAR